MTQVSPVVPAFQHYQQQQDRLEQEAKRIAQENQEDAAKQQAARDAARVARNSQMWRQCQDDIKVIEQAIRQLK